MKRKRLLSLLLVPSTLPGLAQAALAASENPPTDSYCPSARSSYRHS